MSSPLVGLVLAFLAPQSGAPPAPTAKTTQEVSTISVRSTDGKTRLRTFCLDRDGRIVALVAPPLSRTLERRNSFGEVHILDRNGKPVSHWEVKGFQTHSIAVAPDGTFFVAGEGKVARYTAEGKQLRLLELPHVAAVLKDPNALRARIAEQLHSQKQSLKNAIKLLNERKKRIEAKDESARTELDNRQLAECIASLRQTLESAKQLDAQTPDQEAAAVAGRLRAILGVAVSERDVFVVCGEENDYRHSVWRLDHDLANPKRVLSGLKGCRVQVDAQVHRTDLLVAENMSWRYARYDRDGKKLAAVPTRSETDGPPPGGWCSPMNLCVLPGGDVLASESDGVVKRFSAAGDFLGVVGGAPFKGGCKPAAIAFWPRDNRLYLADVGKSRIIVLTPVAPVRK